MLVTALTGGEAGQHVIEFSETGFIRESSTLKQLLFRLLVCQA